MWFMRRHRRSHCTRPSCLPLSRLLRFWNRTAVRGRESQGVRLWGWARLSRNLKPFLTLAQTLTPEGAELTLHSHDGHFFLRVNRQPLMGTNASMSEMRLAELACHHLKGRKGRRVLIGGLGFGFSLRRVLEMVTKDSVAHVAELCSEVVRWNREFLGDVNGKLID